MFCGKCGTKINDGDSFCTNCGAIVNLEDIKTENTKNCDLTSQINKTKCVSDYNEDTCVNVMDTIKFGMYPQNDISGSRKEAIEWLVLEKDDLNHRALLTTKYILDSKYFNKGEIFGNSWNTTNSLRLWLNNHFINTAFNALDKNIILNFNDFQRNFNASDEEFSSKVFLLTKEEIKKYFGEENIHQYNKKAACKGTAYSKRDKNLYIKFSDDEGYEWRNGNSNYWICSRDDFNIDDVDIVNIVNYDGYLEHYTYDGYAGVRPSIWVNYS